MGYQLRLKSMQDALHLSTDLYKKIEKAFGAQLSMWDPTESKLFILATYYIDQVGLAQASEVTFMNATNNLLPFENNYEKTSLDGLVEAQRRFTKSMRFNLKMATPIATAVLTDTEQPVAMFIQLPGSDVETFDAKVDEVTAMGMPTWVWKAGQARAPELPPPGGRQTQSH